MPPSFSDYADAINQVIGNRKLKIIVEPGRSLIAKAGVLLTSIEYIKEGNSKNFAIVDAAMNDLMRPSLYDAYHEIINIISHNLDKKNMILLAQFVKQVTSLEKIGFYLSKIKIYWQFWIQGLME